jgi:hypothetical protein
MTNLLHVFYIILFATAIIYLVEKTWINNHLLF